MDLWCLEQALQQLVQDETSTTLALSLSAQLLSNEAQSQQFLKLLKSAPDKAPLLRLGFPEYGAYQHLDKLRDFSAQLQALGLQCGH